MNLINKMEVWTASYIDCHDRFLVLQECIQSVHNLGLPHFVSISLHNHDMTEIKALTNCFPRLCIFTHDDRLRQFEHFSHLLSVSKSDDATTIIFLDDDDILVGIPKKGFRAKQYSSYYWNTNTIYQPYHPFDEKSHTLYDFSGNTCTQHQLRLFINNMREYLAFPTLDLVFSSIIDTPDDTGPPTVFKRKWNIFKYKMPWQESKIKYSIGDIMKHADPKMKKNTIING